LSEVIIIGGGIIGMLTARELHEAGIDVLVIERGSLGGESSWAGGGIISPLYPWRYDDSVNQLAEMSKTIYPRLAQQLQEESGIDTELITSGLLFVDRDETDQAIEWAKQWSVKLEIVTGREQIREIEPQTSEAIDAGLWLPDIMQIRNPRLVKALKGSMNALGIKYLEHSPVEGLIIESGNISGVLTESGPLEADKVITASGAWTANLVSQVANVEVEPVKGQMIMFHGQPGLVKRMVLSGGHYIIPRQDGRLLAGSTLERTGFDKAVSEAALEELKRDAINIIPALADMEIERHWAGLRPGTHKGIPYICKHPEVEGLYIHTGHYRNGVVLGAASAKLMAEIVLDQPTSLESAPYACAAEH
jgi:glycine oxidase